MDLKDFVKRAIVDVAEAVVQADEEIKKIGGLANPGTHDYGATVSQTNPEFVASRTTVNFDIALTAASESSSGGGGGLKIWVVSASLEGKELEKSNSVSRLTFSIDVVLPWPPDQRDRVGKVSKPRK